MDHAKNNNVPTLDPENRSIITGFYFPKFNPVQLFDFAGRPRRLPQDFQIFKDLQGISLGKTEKIALGARRVNKMPFIHGAV